MTTQTSSEPEYTCIANMPTCVLNHHESVLRAWHILRKVKWLLEKKTDPEVIVELIALMERNSAPDVAHNSP